MAAPKIDIETVLAEVLAILTANFNTRLAAITTEKADDITLAAIDSGAYFFQDLNGKTANFNPFVLYQVSSIETSEDEMGHTLTSLRLVVAVVLADEGQDETVARRLFRYGRALREVLEENWELPKSAAKLSIISQVPIAVALTDSSELHRAIGVTLKVELG